MPAAQQKAWMRTLVRDFNVCRCAGRMLLDASRWRERQPVMSNIHAQGGASCAGSRGQREKRSMLPCRAGRLFWRR